MDKVKKAAHRKLRKKAIKVQNAAFPRKVSMAEALQSAGKPQDV